MRRSSIRYCDISLKWSRSRWRKISMTRRPRSIVTAIDRFPNRESLLPRRDEADGKDDNSETNNEHLFWQEMSVGVGSGGVETRGEARAILNSEREEGECAGGGMPARSIHYAKPAIRGWNMFRVPQSVTGRTVGEGILPTFSDYCGLPNKRRAPPRRLALRGCTRFPVICNSNDR